MDGRIFELLGDDDLRASQLTAIIAREFGMADDEAFAHVRRVLRERGTPRLAAIRAGIAELGEIRF